MHKKYDNVATEPEMIVTAINYAANYMTTMGTIIISTLCAA